MISWDDLNPQQRDAVQSTQGPLLIIAGAGSGKTRVLTYRIAHLLQEHLAAPWQILAITFTNKAANEMRERICSLAGEDGEAVWAYTFHSFCVRILRRYADRLGYTSHFTIYDADDQKSLLKQICKRLQIDTKQHKEKTFLNAISAAKDELIDPVTFAEQAAGDFSMRLTAEVYEQYQKALSDNDAMDFDDLIAKTVELFRTQPDVLSELQQRFRYISVDEYQDTNTAQFELVHLLSQSHGNLCVVGDDDQSIYKFRGANIQNILSFEKVFPQAKIIRLEQNYRSTQTILDAANAVISHNVGRREKNLWTDRGRGERIIYRQLASGQEEAEYVAKDILFRTRQGARVFGDCAILYRTNAQSRIFEECFIRKNVPYRIVGGQNFYARREIKDVLSYLKVIDSGRDDLSLLRILNVPKRGIGAASVQKVQTFAGEGGLSLFEAVSTASRVPGLGRTAEKMETFSRMILRLRAEGERMPISDLITEILDMTDYLSVYADEDAESIQARQQNIDELISKAADYEQKEGQSGLSGFLEEVALVAEGDTADEGADRVQLMTLHSAKGLEFSSVYLVGMEDGLFPGKASILGGQTSANGINEDIEEERRLCYVGITRAKRHLTLTSAKERMIRGMTQAYPPSRFLREIPPYLLDGAVPEPAEEQKTLDPLLYDPADLSQRIKRQVRKGGSAKPYGSSGGGFTETTRSFDGGSGKKNSYGSLAYGVGDRVHHIKFGDGTVKDIAEGGRDYEVTVDFDKSGTRKMFASFAKLKKIGG